MATCFARPGRRRFHHPRTPAVDQHSAAARDLAANLERELADSARRVPRADNRYY